MECDKSRAFQAPATPPTHSHHSLTNQKQHSSIYICVFDSTTQWPKQAIQAKATTPNSNLATINKLLHFNSQKWAILTKTTTPNRNLAAMNMLHFKGLYKPCMFQLKLNCLTSQLNQLTNPFVMRATYMGGCRGQGGEGGFIPLPLPNSAESTLRKKGLSEEELCSWINDWAWEERIFTGY